MNMEGDAGLRFYVFDIAMKAVKATYRSAMDTLPIDQAMADRIVEEANHAFPNRICLRSWRATWVLPSARCCLVSSPAVSVPVALKQQRPDSLVGLL